MAKKSDETNKFTPGEMMAIWSALADLVDLNESRDPVFEVHRKRIMAQLQPELSFFMKLTDEEKDIVAGEAISFTFRKIPAEVLPPLMHDSIRYGLGLVVDGVIPEPKPRLADLLKNRKKKEAING